MHATKEMTFDNSKTKRMELLKTIAIMSIVTLMVSFFAMNPAFCIDANETINDILGKVLNIIKLAFQVVGVILTVYSIFQLVLAIKNEDADAKSRASTQLVVAIILIALPTIIDAMGLTDNLVSIEE